MISNDSSPSFKFTGFEKQYLHTLNSISLDHKTLLFRLHAADDPADRKLLWKIVQYKTDDIRWAKAHRNALLLLNATGENLSSRNFSHLQAPGLDFSRPVCLENSILSNSFLPFINLTGACLKGADFRNAILIGAQFGLHSLNHSDEIRCIALHKNYIASVDSTQTLYLWDYQRGVVLYQHPRIKKLKALKLCFTADGNFLFIIEKRKKTSRFSLALWKCLPLEKKYTKHFSSKFNNNLYNCEIINLVCSYNNRHLVALFSASVDKNNAEQNIKSKYNHTLHVWKIISTSNSLQLEKVVNKVIPRVVEHFSLSPISDLFATSSTIIKSMHENERQTEILFWDLFTFKNLGTWIETRPILSLAFASDGCSLVLVEEGGDGKETKAFTRTLALARRFDIFSDKDINKAIFGPSSSLFAYFTDNQNICVRSIYDRRILARLKVSEEELQDLFLSFTEKELIGRCKKIIKIWQISEISKFWKSPLEGIENIVFSQDSKKTIVVSGTDLKIVKYVTDKGIRVDRGDSLVPAIKELLKGGFRARFLPSSDNICFELKKNQVSSTEILLYTLFSEEFYFDNIVRDLINYTISANNDYIVFLKRGLIEIYNLRKSVVSDRIDTKRIHTINTKSLIACALNKRGKGLIATISDGRINIFNLNDGKNSLLKERGLINCNSLSFARNNKILTIYDGKSLELRRLPSLEKIQYCEQSKHFDFFPEDNFLVNYFFIDKKNKNLSLLKGHIIQIINIKTQRNLKVQVLKFNSDLEFNVDFPVSGLKCAPNGRNFVIWSSDKSYFQMYSFENGSVRLIWQDPIRLDIENIKTQGLIADEVTESILHYPRIKPQIMEEVSSLVSQKSPFSEELGPAIEIFLNKLKKQNFSSIPHIQKLEKTTLRMWLSYRKSNENVESNEEVESYASVEQDEEVEQDRHLDSNEEVDPNEGIESDEEVNSNEEVDSNQEVEFDEGVEPDDDVRSNEEVDSDEGEVDSNEDVDSNQEVEFDEDIESDEEVFNEIETYLPKIEFKLILGLRLLEIVRLEKLYIQENLRTDTIRNVFRYHSFLLEEESKRIYKFISLVRNHSRKFLWINYDWRASSDACFAKLNLNKEGDSVLSEANLRSDWGDSNFEQLKYAWIMEFQSTALELSDEDFIMRFDVHERMRIIDLAVMELKEDLARS